MSLLEAWEFFRWSILAILVAGTVLPLIGSWLFVRRTSFHGLALPQFAASGVALGFLLLPWFVGQGMFGGLPLEEVAADTHDALNYHLAFAALGTFVGLGLLVLVGDRLGTESARVAGAFAVEGYNLAGGAMIKDNHIAAAGSIHAAVARVRAHAPFLIRIEVEVTTMGELEQALEAGADVVMLDNMTTAQMRDAVQVVAGRALVEASGNITLGRLAELRDVGLDVISSGALTHSAPNADISLRILGPQEGA